MKRADYWSLDTHDIKETVSETPEEEKGGDEDVREDVVSLLWKRR